MNDKPWTREASVTIDGTQLTPGQSMTVRVALEMFAMDLTEHGAPADGTTEAGYLRCINEIRRMRRNG